MTIENEEPVMPAPPLRLGVNVDHVATRPLSATRVETSFDQAYASAGFKDSMHKTLTWDRVGSEWKIVGASNR